MADKHPLFQAATEVGEELARRKQKVMKAPPVPFGKERVDSRTLRSRLESNPSIGQDMIRPDNPDREQNRASILWAYAPKE